MKLDNRGHFAMGLAFGKSSFSGVSMSSRSVRAHGRRVPGIPPRGRGVARNRYAGGKPPRGPFLVPMMNATIAMPADSVLMAGGRLKAWPC